MLTNLRHQRLRSLKRNVQTLQYYALDSFDYFLGRRNDLTPPTALVGGHRRRGFQGDRAGVSRLLHSVG